MSDNEARQHRYLGYDLIGTNNTPSGLDGNRYKVTVWKRDQAGAEDIVFTEHTDITGSDTTKILGDRQQDPTHLLETVSFAKARARIATQSFEPSGEYSDSYKQYQNINNSGLSSKSIQAQILNCLLNIRKLDPDRFNIERLDIPGFILLLDISEEKYLFNAGLLLEKGLINQSTIDQLNIRNGGIFITHEGIDYLGEKGGESKVYGVGDAYKFHIDLRRKLSDVSDNVFIIDPYFDAGSFDLYIPVIPAGVMVRILLKTADGPFMTVLRKFRAKESANLKVRVSQDIHDRVLFIDDKCWAIGQSIKDAAMKKPTYVILSEESDMKEKYDPIWEEAESL